jgi:hypothetical protein
VNKIYVSMPVKKKEETPANSNINTNNINIKIEQPKASRKITSPKKDKPNWIVKAIVIGVIGLALSLIGYYLKKTMEGGHGKPVGGYIIYQPSIK